MSASGAIRILLVDGQPAVRRGLKMRFALEEDLEVVGEASGAREAISLAGELRPDVILMDDDIPGNPGQVGGIRAIGTLRGASPRSAVVIFTLRDDAATRELARTAGAADFVEKHRPEETLLAAIRGVAPEGKRRRNASKGREESEDDMRDRGDS